MAGIMDFPFSVPLTLNAHKGIHRARAAVTEIISNSMSVYPSVYLYSQPCMHKTSTMKGT